MDTIHAADDPTPAGAATPNRSERGQGLVEYAFILMLVALLLILTVAVLGHQTAGLYSNVENAWPH